MNFRDSEFALGHLLDSGFKKASSMEKADIILFNSCSVRKHAEDRLFSNIADLKNLKKKRPDLVIGLIGCAAQCHKAKVMEKAPLVDFVCGPGNEFELPRIIKEVMKSKCPIIAIDKVNEKRPELFPEYRAGFFKAYVSISEGCDNYCSYCIVPYVRGRERSRLAKDIIHEVRDLAERGFKEIMLLGQNVNSYRNSERGRRAGFPAFGGTPFRRGNPPYGNGCYPFIRLLEQLNGIKGIERIRFMTSHPKDASIDLFRAMRDLENVCEHMHLPLQSGSDKILKLMNRGYSRQKYMKLVESYKKLLPQGSLTTDIVVGFPSEKEMDFKKTLNLMKNVRFDNAFLFKYSPRPPAKSASLKDDVPEDVKARRFETIASMQCKISEERNVPAIGKAFEILVDGKNKRDPSMLTGRTRTNKMAIFKGEDRLIGEIVNVKVGSVTPHTLQGRIVRETI